MNPFRSIALVTALALGGTEDQIAKLDSPAWREREAATAALRKNLTADTIAKLEAILKTGTFEQVRRAELILAPYHSAQNEKIARETVAKMKILCQGKLPWISGEVYGYHTWATGTDAAPDWERHRNATELYLLELARCGKPLEPAVEQLKERELEFIEEYKDSFSPPLSPRASAYQSLFNVRTSVRKAVL